MYKRDRQNNESITDYVQTKKARKDPLSSITSKITNINVNDKFSNALEVAHNHVQEARMECETVENYADTKENSGQQPSIQGEAFKYNSICDRDRRRHMYF